MNDGGSPFFVTNPGMMDFYSTVTSGFKGKLGPGSPTTKRPKKLSPAKTANSARHIRSPEPHTATPKMDLLGDMERVQAKNEKLRQQRLKLAKLQLEDAEFRLFKNEKWEERMNKLNK